MAARYCRSSHCFRSSFVSFARRSRISRSRSPSARVVSWACVQTQLAASHGLPTECTTTTERAAAAAAAAAAAEHSVTDTCHTRHTCCCCCASICRSAHARRPCTHQLATDIRQNSERESRTTRRCCNGGRRATVVVARYTASHQPALRSAVELLGLSARCRGARCWSHGTHCHLCCCNATVSSGSSA